MAKAKRSKGREYSADRITFLAFSYTVITLLTIACLIPFLMIISSSFTSERSILIYGYSLWPRDFSLESYRLSLANPNVILRAYWNTIVVTVVGTVFGVFVNSMAGYVLTRKDFPWRNLFAYFFFFTTLFSGGLVPYFILVSNTLGLRNNLLALILPGAVSVWNMLLVKGFMSGIPFEITESAKMDGAGDFTVYLRFIMPLAKPVIATIALFSALAFWNDWFNTMLFITDERLFTLQYFLQRLLSSVRNIRAIMDEAGVDIPTLPVQSMKMSLTIIVTGPIIFLYPFIQRYFIQGLTLGSVKG
ncbi:MAG: carbohydrate ABC transporter permease [Defluviitaleaceae bacterium]|nr:carbohydrate ABC transporter permease [Defluviitaleaceae bacterium]